MPQTLMHCYQLRKLLKHLGHFKRPYVSCDTILPEQFLLLIQLKKYRSFNPGFIHDQN